MKKTYDKLKINVIVLEANDIVTFSVGNDENDVIVDDPYWEF